MYSNVVNVDTSTPSKKETNIVSSTYDGSDIITCRNKIKLKPYYDHHIKYEYNKNGENNIRITSDGSESSDKPQNRDHHSKQNCILRVFQKIVFL